MVYDICLGNEKAGQATVEQQGLYYKIRCRCRLSGQVRFHVRAMGSAGEEDLGLLVPEGKEFCLCGSVAVKKLGDELRFCLMPRHPEHEGVFVPLRSDEPFAYLMRLKEAVLSSRNGQTGIMFQTSKESSSPTGQ